MGDTIMAFRGEYYFLSNFKKCEVSFEGLVYKSSEAAYQSAKTLDIEERKQFTEMGAFEAKEAGRRLRLRSDWEEVKDNVMLEILRSKFKTGSGLAQKLLDTGDTELIEGNTWGDHYWGICNGVGHNKLGKLLMKVRSELMEQAQLEK